MKKTETVGRRALLGSLALALALSSPHPAEAQKGTATASWDIVDAVTTIELNASTISGLGFEAATLGPGVAGYAPHPLSVASADAPSFQAAGPIGLRAIVAADGFHGFEGGTLRHSGGFRLQGGVLDLDFSSLELRPGRKATTLELVDAAGVALLATADAQWELDVRRGLLRYLNADVRILPALARRLGDERYTGVTVGVSEKARIARSASTSATRPAFMS